MHEKTKIKFMAGFLVVFFTIGFGSMAVSFLTSGAVLGGIVAGAVGMTVNWVIVKLATEELTRLNEQEK